MSASDDFDTFMQSLAENYNQSEVVFSGVAFNENFLKDFNQAGSILPPDLSLDFSNETGFQLPFGESTYSQPIDPELQDHLQSQSKHLMGYQFNNKSQQIPPRSDPKNEGSQFTFQNQNQSQNQNQNQYSFQFSGIKPEPDDVSEMFKQEPLTPNNPSATFEDLLSTTQGAYQKTPSPQNSPPFFSASPHSPPNASPLSHSYSTPESPSCEDDPKDQKALSEILDRISWKGESDSNRPIKRKRETDPAAIRQKHTEAEQKRRNEMNRAINDIARLLPSYSEKTDPKKTKLSVLIEASDYFKRVQRLCSQLLVENKSLKDELNKFRPGSSSGTHQHYSSGSSEYSPSSSQNGTYHQPRHSLSVNLFAICFLFLFASFTPFGQFFLPGSQVPSSRDILNNDSLDSNLLSQHEVLFALSILASFLWSNLFALISVLLSFSIVVYFLNFEISLIFGYNEKQLQQARQEIMAGFMQRDRGHLGKAKGHFTHALELLNLGLPSSWYMTLFCTVCQLFRRIFQALWIGIWLERRLLGNKKTQLVFSEAAKAYSGILLPDSYFYTGELQYLYLSLCAINSATVSGDPVSLANIYAEVSFRLSSQTSLISRTFSHYAREKAWKIVKQMKETNTANIGKLFYAQGICYLQTCNFEEARAQLTKAINLYHNTEGRQERLVQMSLAVVHLFEGANENALQLFLHSYKNAVQEDDVQSTIWALLGMGSCFVGLGEYEKAIIVLRRTAAEHPKFTMTEQILCKALQAMAYFGVGDFERSLQLGHEALDDSKQPVDKKFFVLLAFQGLADCFLNLLEISRHQNSKGTTPLTTSTETISLFARESCQLLEELASSTPLMKPIALRCQARYLSLSQEHEQASHVWEAALLTAEQNQWKCEVSRIKYQIDLYRPDFCDDDHSDEYLMESASV